MTRTTFTATLTGLLDLCDPDPAQITLPDLALKLATKCRWGGVLNPPLSVAQHSVMVANALPAAMRIFGLLHDAHEAYLGDITTPVETTIGRDVVGFERLLESIKVRLDIAICRAFKLPPPATIEIYAAVRDADLRMAATEWVSLMPEACGPNPIPAQPYRHIRVRPWAWPDAEAKFHEAVDRELALRSWEQAA